MRNVVGVVSKVSGKVTRKDFENGVEDDLHLGDAVRINDNVWLRSLDAVVEIILYNKTIMLQAGTRITLDHKYLAEQESDDFFDMREVEEIVRKLKGEDGSSSAGSSQNSSITDNSPVTANIWVTSSDNSRIIKPVVDNNILSYNCDFGEILIHVNTKAFLDVKLMSFDESAMYAAISTNDQGVGIFALNEANRNVTHNLTVVIYENGQIAHKSKISLLINHDSQEKKN